MNFQELQHFYVRFSHNAHQIFFIGKKNIYIKATTLLTAHFVK